LPRSAPDDEIVQFPVPRRRLRDVIRLLARLSDSTPSKDNLTRPWTKDELKWLRQLLENRPIALELLDTTAYLDGNPLTFAELCAATGVTPARARGELASLTSIVSEYFDREQWPVDAHWESGGFCYRMNPATAKLWDETAAES
jgi:hypothetical protein